MDTKPAKVRTMTVNQLRTLAKSLGAKRRNLRRFKRFLIMLCIDLLKHQESQAKQARKDALEERRAQKPPKQWYALAVRPRQERGVRKRIKREAKKKGIGKWFGRMMVPVDYNLKLVGGKSDNRYLWDCPKCGQVDNAPTKRGTPRCNRCGGLIQAKVVTSKSKGQHRIIAKDKRLPGYLLCNLSLTDTVINLVKGVRGVLGFLPFGSKIPTVIDEDEVARVCEAKEGDPVKGKFAKLKAGEIRPGHYVKILKLSPFMDMEGTVKQVVQDDKGPILLVEIKVLGCPTPVKLEHWMVKRISELSKEE